MRITLQLEGDEQDVAQLTLLLGMLQKQAAPMLAKPVLPDSTVVVATPDDRRAEMQERARKAREAKAAKVKAAKLPKELQTEPEPGPVTEPEPEPKDEAAKLEAFLGEPLNAANDPVIAAIVGDQPEPEIDDETMIARVREFCIKHSELNPQVGDLLKNHYRCSTVSRLAPALRPLFLREIEAMVPNHVGA